jgi:hypothetical protein
LTFVRLSRRESDLVTFRRKGLSDMLPDPGPCAENEDYWKCVNHDLILVSVVWDEIEMIENMYPNFCFNDPYASYITGVLPDGVGNRRSNRWLRSGSRVMLCMTNR